MIKVHILTTCARCNGQAYLPVGTEHDANGNPIHPSHPLPGLRGQRPGTHLGRPG